MLKTIVYTALLLIGLNLNAEELDINIPVVDMQDFYNTEKQDEFINTLHKALTEIGFFAVRNTGIDREVIKKAYAQSESFFQKDAAYKAQSFLPHANGQRGFVPGEIAKGSQTKDCKEYYHIGRELPADELKKWKLFPNVWPDQEGFKESMTTLFTELEKYVIPLQEAICMTINRDATTKIALDTLHQTTVHGDSLLRVLYYPAVTQDQIDASLTWAAEHTDIDFISILPFATAKGLQLEINEKWHNVVVPEDAFVINAGDFLRNLTNGLFISSKHRVIAGEPNMPRYSMVLFVHPTADTSLAPLASCIEQTGGVQKYAPGTRLEFLWERLLELNVAPTVLEPYSKTGHTERQIRFGKQSPQVVQMLIENGLASEEVLKSVE